MGENTPFISKVDKNSVIEFDWGSIDLKTFWMDQEGHDNWTFEIKFSTNFVYKITLSGLGLGGGLKWFLGLLIIVKRINF